MKRETQIYDYVKNHRVPIFFPAFYDIHKKVRENYADLRKYCEKKNKYNDADANMIYGPFDDSNQYVDSLEKNVSEVTTWIFKNIITKLDIIDYVTVSVLLRIATGLLDKTYLSKDNKILFHDNMVRNIRQEYERIIDEDLPF